jgi:uncharacterized protein YbaA (DUF1428 family)
MLYNSLKQIDNAWIIFSWSNYRSRFFSKSDVQTEKMTYHYQQFEKTICTEKN